MAHFFLKKRNKKDKKHFIENIYNYFVWKKLSRWILKTKFGKNKTKIFENIFQIFVG